MKWNAKCYVLYVCQVGDLFFRDPTQYTEIFYYLWTLASVNMIEASGNGNCQGNLTKRVCKTHYIPGSKITLEGTFFKLELYSVNCIGAWPFKSFPLLGREEGERPCCSELPILNYEQQPDLTLCFRSHRMTKCATAPNRQLNGQLFRWVWCVFHVIVYSIKQ